MGILCRMGMTLKLGAVSYVFSKQSGHSNCNIWLSEDFLRRKYFLHDDFLSGHSRVFERKRWCGYNSVLSSSTSIGAASVSSIKIERCPFRFVALFIESLLQRVLRLICIIIYASFCAGPALFYCTPSPDTDDLLNNVNKL